MLAVGDEVGQALHVERVVAERVRGDLAVKDEGGDVGVVGRDLAPALRPVVRADPHHGDLAGGERLDARDPHRPPSPARAQNVITLRSAVPARTPSSAALISASGY